MLSTADKERIVDTVKQVETDTGGEVVVFVADQSDEYSVARWRAAVFFFLGFLAIVLAIRPVVSDWVPVLLGNNLSLIILGIIAGLAGGLLTPGIPMLKRAFVLDREFSREVSKAAAEAFIAEEVFATTLRNGVLIFVSELERMFEVVADSGIDSRIDDNEWVAVIDRMIEEHETAGLTNAIVTGVEACGDLFAREIPNLANQRNELDDQVRENER